MFQLKHAISKYLLVYPLLFMFQMCDVAEQASLEQIIGELFNQNDVDSKVIQSLWNIIIKQLNTPSSPNNTRTSLSTSMLPNIQGGDNSRTRDDLLLIGGLNVISMIARIQPDIITPDKVRLLTQIASLPTNHGKGLLNNSNIATDTANNEGITMSNASDNANGDSELATSNVKKMQDSNDMQSSSLLYIHILKSVAKCLQHCRGGSLASVMFRIQVQSKKENQPTTLTDLQVLFEYGCYLSIAKSQKLWCFDLLSS